jgi:hypothetical protein
LIKADDGPEVRVARGGVVAWLSDRDSKSTRDEDGSALKRLRQVLSSSTALEDADPTELEARIRNLSHGTNRNSRHPDHIESQ